MAFLIQKHNTDGTLHSYSKMGCEMAIRKHLAGERRVTDVYKLKRMNHLCIGPNNGHEAFHDRLKRLLQGIE